VVQLVEAWCYEQEGGRFDSRWCHWNFLLTLPFRPYYDPRVDSVGNRNEYQEYFLERSVRRTDNLTTFLFQLSRNPGASTYWKGVGLYEASTGIALPLLHFLKKYISSCISGIKFFSFLRNVGVSRICESFISPECNNFLLVLRS